MENYEYDKLGRLKYHPDLHPNKGRRMTFEERVYLCTFWEFDSVKTMSMALGRTEASLCTKVNQLKENSEFETYRRIGKLKLGFK